MSWKSVVLIVHFVRWSNVFLISAEASLVLGSVLVNFRLTSKRVMGKVKIKHGCLTISFITTVISPT